MKENGLYILTSIYTVQKLWTKTAIFNKKAKILDMISVLKNKTLVKF